MADDQELGIKIKVKGSAEAKRQLEDIINSVGKGVERARGRRGAGGGAQGLSGRSRAQEERSEGTSVGSVFKGAFLANIASSALQRSFSALTQGVSQAFDPNLTDLEKQFRVRSAFLGSLPGGEIAQAAFGASNQVELGTAQGTQQRLQQTFGQAAQAIATANPNASDEELKQLFRDRLGPAIENFAKIIERQERGREVFSQFTAKEFGPGGERLQGEAQAISEASALVLEESKNLISRMAEAVPEGLTQPLGKALANAEFGLKKFSTALEEAGSKFITGIGLNR